MRQCGHRYAIRAGRNLPDKEFRYLRTVIVTAAVYRGFDQELAPHHLTFRHRAGVTPYTSTFVLAQCCVFVKQSQPPILCGPLRLPLCTFTYQGHTFSRSYGINLPSSLTRVLSSALAYSARPPVSVCGTVGLKLKLRGFSWKQGIAHFVKTSLNFAITPRLSPPDLPKGHAYTFSPGHPTPGRGNLLRLPIAFQIGTGILTCFPSTTHLCLILGAD